jgi:hypothetical protein
MAAAAFVASTAGLGARPAAAGPPIEIVVGDMACQVDETLTFDAGATTVNLDAQAKLNLSLQWVMDAQGRELIILGADGPRPADVRLGNVRVSAVMSFLVANGAHPDTLSRSDFRELGPSRIYYRTNVDNVIVLACDAATPIPGVDEPEARVPAPGGAPATAHSPS